MWLESPLLALVLDSDLSPSVLVLAIPATIGAIGITMFQMKVGKDHPINAVGKVIIGFGIGYWLGGFISAKLSVDIRAGALIGGLGSPAILASINSKVSWFGKAPDKEEPK